VGVTNAHLSRLLRGVGYRTRPSADLARRVAIALGLPADYFCEYREAAVIEEIKRNPQLREELYERLKRR
jgi:transcriptional regulator with XRE-family HTH domain